MSDKKTRVKNLKKKLNVSFKTDMHTSEYSQIKKSADTKSQEVNILQSNDVANLATSVSSKSREVNKLESDDIANSADKKSKDIDNSVGSRDRDIGLYGNIAEQGVSSEIKKPRYKKIAPRQPGAVKSKATFCLDTIAVDQLNRVYASRLINGYKFDRSSLICEAISLLFEKEKITT